MRMQEKRQNTDLKKRILCVALAALLLAFGFTLPGAEKAGLCVAALADDLWSNDYYRASDVTGDLSDAQQQSLDEACIEFMETNKVDLSLLVTTKDKYPDATIEELAKGYFEDCDFGYGDTRDGFSVVIDADTLECAVIPMGNTKGMIDDRYLAFIKKTAVTYQEEYGSFGMLYCSYRLISSYFEEHGDGIKRDAGDFAVSAEAEELEQEIEDAAPEVGEEVEAEAAETSEANGAEDPESLDLTEVVRGEALSERIERTDADSVRGQLDPETQADESRPRVVDHADIFTDEEEKSLEARLYEIRKECKRDLVVFTDDTDMGKGHDVYSADFYDYNGYGCGENFEGACLFICMDPDNRGFWTCCSGSKTRNAYSEFVANQSDDFVFVCMKRKLYGDGAAIWAENMRRIILYDSPLAYDWVVNPEPEQVAQDETAPRLVDDGLLFTPQEAESLESEARRLADTYKTDVVIHTVYDTWELERGEYADKFWRVMGYGTGENRSGIMVTIFKKYGYSGTCYVTGYGDMAEKLNDKAASRLGSRSNGKLNADDAETPAYDSMELYLSMLEHYFKKGRVPRSMGSWIGFTVFELIIGLIVAAILHGKAKKGMETPAIKENAAPYLVPRSLVIQKLNDRFLRQSESRKYNPPSESRSSGSSSGRSSYSSSYSGSSGRSHSGSGRSF